MAAVAKTVAAVVTPCTPLLALKINPAPRKPIPVITACKALVGSAVLAFSPTTSPIATIIELAPATKAIVRGPADFPARSRSQPIKEPKSTAIAPSIIIESCTQVSIE
jgi:hypothetical protein